PGVQKFAEMMKETMMIAHDEIIAHRVLQAQQYNKKRVPAPFKVNDLVYLSTENLSIPKLKARKLVPKYIGPFRILK
ncbi:hypothetical protein EXIGLDRAFT_579293, partial [Exidia glandulosa HHB12029]